jgi:hypothetical protein
VTDVRNPRTAAAVHAEILCGRCPSTAADEAAGPAGPCPSLVVRLPIGGREPMVRLARDGWTIVVEAREGPLVWEHEIDLPFPVTTGGVAVHRDGTSVEVRVPVPAQAPVPA